MINTNLLHEPSQFFALKELLTVCLIWLSSYLRETAIEASQKITVTLDIYNAFKTNVFIGSIYISIITNSAIVMLFFMLDT